MFRTRYDVFLSYSHMDKELVRPLLDELRRLGYRTFFDMQSVDPGERWKRRLERAIRASRTLVLCWSEAARGSDYVTFEYSRAEALRKPVFPWLLDSTPLPAMLEIQGIAEPDASRVADALRPKLGWTLSQRRTIQAIAVLLLAVALACGAWRYLHPPLWKFEGNIVDRQTLMPIGGVEVDIVTALGRYATFTDKRGNYVLPIAQPRPRSVAVLFRKEGYEAEHPISVSTTKPFSTDMEKLH
jgi:hypothetical protein